MYNRNIPQRKNANNTPHQNAKLPDGKQPWALTIICSVRTFAHTRLHRRSYFLVINRKGKRIAGGDFLLSRTVTHAQALKYARIQAERWQCEANHPDAVIVCLRPDFTDGRTI